MKLLAVVFFFVIFSLNAFALECSDVSVEGKYEIILGDKSWGQIEVTEIPDSNNWLFIYPDKKAGSVLQTRQLARLSASESTCYFNLLEPFSRKSGQFEVTSVSEAGDIYLKADDGSVAVLKKIKD